MALRRALLRLALADGMAVGLRKIDRNGSAPIGLDGDEGGAIEFAHVNGLGAVVLEEAAMAVPGLAARRGG